MSKINDAYKKLDACRTVAKEKGDAGEEILVSLAREYQEDQDCVILWSYTYPYASNRDSVMYTGNIKLHDGKFIQLTKEGYNDEIDLVIITSYRIFVVECKARSGKWLVYDHWAKQNNKDVDKSPITQCEKHARHFYHSIFRCIPDGKPEYIVPITAFVDRCVLTDKRSKKYRDYIKVCIANTFKKVMREYDKPGDYKLCGEEILKQMLEIGTARKVYR